MRVPLALLSCLGPCVLASVLERRGCAADNCARAVTGTRRGSSAMDAARGDCSSFLLSTTTLQAQPTIFVSTMATTVTASRSGVVRRSASSISGTDPVNSVPIYASACSGASRYSSACSCWGITGSTITVMPVLTSVTEATIVSVKASIIPSGTLTTHPLQSTSANSTTAVSATGSIASPGTSTVNPPQSTSLATATNISATISIALSSTSTTNQLQSTSETTTISISTTTTSIVSSSISATNKLQSTSTTTTASLSTSSSAALSSTSTTNPLRSTSATTTTSISTMTSIALSSTSTGHPTGYHPVIPTSYSACLLDPNDSSKSLELIDQTTGISFINIGGNAVLATNNIIDSTTYHFERAQNSPAGVFDIVSDGGQYVAVFQDGHVGFASTSSNGQTYIRDSNGNTYVTTIWSVSCSDGSIQVGIIGGARFQLVISGSALYVRDASSTKRDLPVALEIVELIVFLLEFRTDLGIDDPRCPNPALNPVVKFGARDPFSNGCGSPPFTYNYKPFADAGCCDAHDLCYDDCDETYLHCNNVFGTCTVSSCDTAYPGTDISSQASHFGCQRLAALFTWIVNSEIGRLLFDGATSDRCTCCPPGQISCSSGCTNPMTDAQNCGKCGNACDSGVCQNGVCSNSVCNGRTCGNFESCGPGGGCLCFTAADGSGFCAKGNELCSKLLGCSSNADCASGSICAVESCCIMNVCIPVDCASSTTTLVRLARDGDDGSTPASLGVWVG